MAPAQLAWPAPGVRARALHRALAAAVAAVNLAVVGAVVATIVSDRYVDGLEVVSYGLVGAIGACLATAVFAAVRLRDARRVHTWLLVGAFEGTVVAIALVLSLTSPGWI